MKYALTLLILLAGVPFLASASDIHYGSIETVTNDTILLHYRGPEGASYHTCSFDGDCNDHGAQSPDILPSLLGRTAYPLSSRGTYGLHTLASGPVTLYTLYALTGDSPERVAFLPFTQFALRTVFSRDEEALVLVTTNGNALRYDIASGTYTTTSVGTDLPFFSLSPRGTYLSAYSYAHEQHRIWNLTTGEQVTIPSETPAFVEMSQDEKYLAYNSGDDLVIATRNTPIRTIQGKAGIITDYIFLENTLYYIANQEDPFVWNLVAHDPETSTEKIIDTNVSYADALRIVQGKLAYGIVQGKHRNIILYNPGDTTATTLSPYSDEPLSEDILRGAQVLGGQHTVVLSPTKKVSHPPLFVWLHGGPQRQTSIGYHPYLSYAVYDELLEGFVEDGAYALKVDYTGSWGYGQAFVEALTNNIGKKDVADVLSAVRTFTQTRDIGDIYLIGNSYGGYLAARALMEDSGLFAGAISINGVTDWYRLATRIPSTPFATLFNGAPEIHNLDQYLNSSIYARVPTDIDENDKILLFHGDRDTSVPAWQSKEFHEVLQNNDKDSRIVELPDTGHIPERSEILESMCEEIDDYFSLALSCR